MGNNIDVVTAINLENTPKGTIQHYWLNLISDPLGNPIRIPVMIARGKKDGPTLGITAAIHGNELNGIPVIQKLFQALDPVELSGTIIGIPVVNIPSFIRSIRRFNDGTDLNHIMPGNKNGNVSQIYAYRFFEKVIKNFDFLLDLHTASQGRINSYYVRADMDNEVTRKLALLQNAQIIVHNPPSDGTLRGAASEINIPAITLEVGNPNTFQRRMISSGITGVDNVIAHLNMIDQEIESPEVAAVICKKSYWIYTDEGGLLTVHSELLDRVKKDDHIATMRDVFGNIRQKYFAPEDGIIIGKSTSPVNQSGGRILHLGIIQ